MRILFLSHYAVPHVGGIEFVVDRLARELTSRGHDVTHIASATSANGQGAVPYGQVLVPAWQIAKEKLSLPYPVFAPRRLWSAIRDATQSADVIHAHGMLYQSSAMAFAIGSRCARVLTEHVGHVPYDNPLLDAAERVAIETVGRFTARRADAIITLNDRVARQMRRLAPRAHHVHIDNGVDLERFRPPAAGEREALRAALGWDERPRVLFVGRLVEKKGVQLAIEAARRANGAFELVLVGPGSLRDLPSHVQLVGEATPDRVAELYRASDVFLLPSRGEGFPLTAQEAMASGLPIVLGNDPAYHSILQGSGGAARLVAADPTTIIAAVREALDHRLRGGDDAQAFARSRFDWSRTTDQHLTCYERVLHG